MLHTSSSICQIFWDIGEQVRVSNVANDGIIVIEAAVVRSKSVVLRTAFGNDDHVERRSEIGERWFWSQLKAGSKEAQGPVDLAVLNPGLRGGS